MTSRAAQLIVAFGLGVVATVSVSLGVRHRHRNVLRPPGPPARRAPPVAVDRGISELARAPAGRLDIELGTLNCDSGLERALRLTWSPDAATLALEGGERTALSPGERRRLLGEIAEAVERPPHGPPGSCSSLLDVALTWELPGEVESRAHFTEPNCGSLDERQAGPGHRVVAALRRVSGSPAGRR